MMVRDLTRLHKRRISGRPRATNASLCSWARLWECNDLRIPLRWMMSATTIARTCLLVVATPFAHAQLGSPYAQHERHDRQHRKEDMPRKNYIGRYKICTRAVVKALDPRGASEDGIKWKRKTKKIDTKQTQENKTKTAPGNFVDQKDVSISNRCIFQVLPLFNPSCPSPRAHHPPYPSSQA